MIIIFGDTNFNPTSKVATLGAEATHPLGHKMIMREYFLARDCGEAEVMGAAKIIRHFAAIAEEMQQPIELRLDNIYAVNVLSGKHREDHLSKTIFPFVRAAKERIARLIGSKVTWIPREMNKRADAIAR